MVGRRKVKMENRRWEEELAGRWCDVLELVAGGPEAQPGVSVPLEEKRELDIRYQRSEMRKQKT